MGSNLAVGASSLVGCTAVRLRVAARLDTQEHEIRNGSRQKTLTCCTYVFSDARVVLDAFTIKAAEWMEELYIDGSNPVHVVLDVPFSVAILMGTAIMTQPSCCARGKTMNTDLV